MPGECVCVWGAGAATCKASSILDTSCSQVSYTVFKLQDLILNSDLLPIQLYRFFWFCVELYLISAFARACTVLTTKNKPHA